MMEVLLRKYRELYLQKSSIVDARLGSKYASAFWRLLEHFISFKYFTLLRPFEFVISLQYFTSFNSSNQTCYFNPIKF